MSSFIHDNSGIIQLIGGRELVDDKRAQEIIELTNFPAIESNPTIIKLSNKSYSPDAAQLIIDKIKSYQTITIADISDIIAGRPEEEALRTLTIVCDAEASANLADILLTSGCPPLTHLHFYNNMAGNGGAIAIAKVVGINPNIIDFRFSATRSGDEGCTAIANALNSLLDLERLDLSDNNFGSEGALALANSIKIHTKLSYLNLRDAGIEDEGVEALIESLTESNAPIKYLDLSGNDLSQDSMEIISKYLTNKLTIEELAFDDNEIESDGLKYLLPSIATLTNLKTISFNSCEITASGAYLLAKTLVGLPSFQLLKINGNMIVDRGIDEITKLLKQFNKEIGDLDDNDVDADDDLDAVLEDNKDEDNDLSKALANVKIND
eukprot:gene23891-31003_t